MKVVVRIGGSIIASPLNPTLIKNYANILNILRKQGIELAVVVGGGLIARKFIKAAKQIGLNQKGQDEVAISISRVIAQLLALSYGSPELSRIPFSIMDAKKIFESNGIVFLGGLKPGMTTDTVAVMLASEIKADLIIKATNQEGIYTKDPSRYNDATMISKLDFSHLSQILVENKHKAGIHQIIDPEAIRLLKKERIRTIVLNGLNPDNILSAAKGVKIGTIIQ